MIVFVEPVVTQTSPTTITIHAATTNGNWAHGSRIPSRNRHEKRIEAAKARRSRHS